MPSSIIDDILQKKKEIEQHNSVIQQKEKENVSRKKQIDGISDKELETDPLKRKEYEKLSQDYKKDASEIESNTWEKSRKEIELKKAQEKSAFREHAAESATKPQQPEFFSEDHGFEQVALNRKENEIKGNNHLDSGKKLNAVDEVLLAKKEVKEAANTVVNTMSQDQQEELRKQAGRGMRK